MSKENDIQIDPLVETYDEDGNKIYFNLLEIIETNNNEYGIFEELGPDKEKIQLPPGAEEEVIVMKILYKNGDYFFEAIEDDDEFEEVLDFIDKHESDLNF
ncbi:MAG: DUF1292 domain-containing protein [Vampirovibrionia bacterium]